jgi:hypothetical protein
VIAPTMKQRVVHPTSDESTLGAVDEGKDEERNPGKNDNIVVSPPLSSDDTGGQRRIQLSHVRHFSLSFWLLSLSCAFVYGTITSFTGLASGLLLEQFMFRDPPGDCVLHQSECNSGYLAPNNDLSNFGNGKICPISNGFAPLLPLSINVTEFEGSSWDHPSYAFSLLSPTDVDCTDNFWSEACTKDYCERKNVATKNAGIMTSVPFMVTVLTTFLFGHYGIDRAKLRLPMVALSPILLILAHGLLVFGGTSPIVPLVILGLGFSIYVAALWPSVALAVPESAMGTAFGTITCIQAMGNAIMPLMVSIVYNQTGQRYAPGVEVFFLSCSAVVLLVGIGLMGVERRTLSNSSVFP